MCPQAPAICYHLAQRHSDFQPTAGRSILLDPFGKMRVKRLVTALLLITLAPHAAGQDLAEVNLLDALDEPRGYCIDMIGYKEGARTNRELRTRATAIRAPLQWTRASTVNSPARATSGFLISTSA
jgi:hypothetical protein